MEKKFSRRSGRRLKSGSMKIRLLQLNLLISRKLIKNKNNIYSLFLQTKTMKVRSRFEKIKLQVQRKILKLLYKVSLLIRNILKVINCTNIGSSFKKVKVRSVLQFNSFCSRRSRQIAADTKHSFLMLTFVPCK